MQNSPITTSVLTSQTAVPTTGARHSGKRWLTSALWLLLVGLTSGCLEDLPQPDTIENLRILGIQAQPPEVAPGDSVTMTALVADPLDREMTLTWHACLRPDRSTGFFSASGAGAAGGRGYGLEDPGTCTEIAETNPEVLYLGDKLSVRLNIPDDFLDDNELIAAYYGISGATLPDFLMDLLKSVAGMNMTVSLVVEVDGDRREAYKRVNVSSNSDKNRNPTEVTFHLTTDAIENPAPDTATPPPGGKCFIGEAANAPLLLPAQEVRITPVNIPEDPDTYQVILGSTDPNQPLGIEDKDEVYFYSLFSTVGGFPDRILKSSSTDPFSNWDLSDHAGKDIGVWIVTRDGRGGTTWCHSQIQVAPPTP